MEGPATRVDASHTHDLTQPAGQRRRCANSASIRVRGGVSGIVNEGDHSVPPRATPSVPDKSNAMRKAVSTLRQGSKVVEAGHYPAGRQLLMIRFGPNLAWRSLAMIKLFSA